MPFEKGHKFGGQKPKGAISHKTKVVNKIVETFNNKALNRIIAMRDGDESQFKRYMDYILALLPKSKEITGEDGKELMPLQFIFPTHDKPE